MKHTPHLPILVDLGLNETEAIIYEVLLEEGPSPGAKVAARAALGRGNAYNGLLSLKTKGLVFEEKGKKNLYRAMDPEKLRSLAKSKRETADALYGQLEAVLPGLKSSYRLFTKQPTVRVFEGVEGIKDLYKETLKIKETIYALVSPDEPATAVFRWLTTTYVKARVEAGIQVKVVVNGASAAAAYIEKNKKELREARFVKSELYPFRGEIDIFGDNVAFIAYKEDELIGVLMESASIAETLRSTVRLLMETQQTPGTHTP